MYETYGKSLTEKCRQCCNYQLKEKGGAEHICIAYSNTYKWDGMSQACQKLYNFPFRGIRPRLTPLENLFAQNTVRPSIIEGQQRLF